MANEVRIKLTGEQKAKIREATGQQMSEIRVSNLGNNPAVTPTSSAKIATARVATARVANARVANARVANARVANARVATTRTSSDIDG